MCIRIICKDHEHEFNPTEPLENQVIGAHKILINYDPTDLKIPSFEDQIELMVKNGASCKAEIEVNTNNDLDGIRLERRIEKLKLALDVNEAVKKLTLLQADTDRRLSEMSNMCIGKIDE